MTVTICYRTAISGERVFSYPFTGSDDEIAAEVHRMQRFEMVRAVWVEEAGCVVL